MLAREAMEEIGLHDFEAIPALNYRWDSEIESELVYCFITIGGKPGPLVSKEITDGKFWKITEIERSLGKNVFTPNFEHEFKLLKGAGLLKSKC